jgi:hypothetical protein
MEIGENLFFTFTLDKRKAETRKFQVCFTKQGNEGFHVRMRWMSAVVPFLGKRSAHQAIIMRLGGSICLSNIFTATT